MNSFYVALPYVLIFAQSACPAIIAKRFARLGPVQSKWRLLLLAALPIPAIIAAFAVFAFKIAGWANDCDVSTCTNDDAALTFLLASALALYLIGLVTALIGYRSGKAAFDHSQSR